MSRYLWVGHNSSFLCQVTIEISPEVSKKSLELTSEFGKAAGYEINTQKSLAFLYANNEKSEREIKESIHPLLQQKELNIWE